MQNEKLENLNLRTKIPHFGSFRQDLKENYCRIWNKYSQICQSEKNPCKTKKVRDQNINYLGAFRLEFETIIAIFKIIKFLKFLHLGPKIMLLMLWVIFLNNYFHICYQHPRFYLIANFGAKIFKFGVKNTWFWIFLGNTVIFKINFLKFAWLQNFV